MFKFLEICRLVPALLFCNIPYGALIRQTPALSCFLQDWATVKKDDRARGMLHQAYFVEWPIHADIPSYLLQ